MVVVVVALLARRLTAEGVPTARGSARWTAAGVARLKARFAAGCMA